MTLDHRDVINATREHYGTVFFLHAAGSKFFFKSSKFFNSSKKTSLILGEHGEDCVGIIRYVYPEMIYPHVKMIFPSAPKDIYNGFDGDVSDQKSLLCRK